MSFLRYRKSLVTHALLLAFVNVSVVLLLAVLTMGTAYRRDPLEFMRAPVRERILSVSRKIALDLFENDSEAWDPILKREAEGTPFTFLLLDNEGRQIAGKHAQIPESVIQFSRNGKAELSYSPKYNQLDRPDRQYSKDNLLLQRDGQTHQYWAGAHVLIHYMDENMYGHGTLIWQFPKLWTNSYFFNFWPYLFLLGGSLLVTVLCWLPAVGTLLRRISRLTCATGDIARGNFKTSLPEGTRDEIGQLTESIALMSRQLSGLIHQQQRFVSDAAHELCSPVSRLQIAVELLRGELSTPELSAAKHFYREESLADLAEEVSYISDLILDLLYYSRERSGRIPLQPVRMNVRSALRDILEREGMVDDAISMNIPSYLELVAPETQIRRAVGNLLRNSKLHAGGRGIDVSAYQREGAVHLLVRDKGPGIPESELDHVFAPFYRLEYARTRVTGGTGLGLAIVKSSVEACCGTVRCRNVLPHGLEVELIFPALTQAATVQAPVTDEVLELHHA